MKTLQLNQYADLFRDKNAYDEFVNLFTASVEADEWGMIFADTEFVCTVMGPEGMREIMQRRILNRFADQPDLLDELRERLESDDLVD